MLWNTLDFCTIQKVLVCVLVCSEGRDVIGTARWSYLACHRTESWWGWVACAARWSHMASGDGMVYASGLYHGGLPVTVGWVASLVVIADSSTTTEHPHQSFHARLFCSVCVCFFFLCTKHA